MSPTKVSVQHFIDFVAIIFVISFLYSLVDFWIPLLEPPTKLENLIFEVMFWILAGWMTVVTFLVIIKAIKHSFNR